MAMKKDTLAVQVGRNPTKQQGTVNPPIHQTSTILFPTLRSYHDADRGKAFYEDSHNVKSYDYSYGITGTPTTYALQQAMTQLENADHSFILPSGLSALTTALFAFLEAGDHILMVDTVYGPTRRFCHAELKRFGVETTYYDPLIGADIAKLVKSNTKIVFTESPGSITFEVQDIPAITKAVKAINEDIVVMIDNSWATPLYFQPFDFGIDISIHAGTKYIGGHSDIMLGVINCKEKHFKPLFKSFHHLGNSASPQDCYLAQRGIRTMPVRLRQHEETALALAKWLDAQDKVAKVLHPALPSCPGHDIWKRDFNGSTGLFSIILDKQYDFEALSRMIDPMQHFGIGCSWGGFESLILNLDPSSARTATKWEAQGSLIRIYAGLEDVDDLIHDLESGLKRL